MVLGVNQTDSEEHQIGKILISIICLYGKDGLPLDRLDEEFELYCGYSIPYKKFGADSLRSWVMTLPEIYIVQDNDGNEILIEQSIKSNHIRELIVKQKNGHRRPSLKRKLDFYDDFCNDYERPYQMKKRFEVQNLPEGSFLHPSNGRTVSEVSNRHGKFEELESMLPLFYKHQALGDDFFLDIADTKLGYYVPENGPKECGLCISGQKIHELTEKVRNATILAPRVVVMIGSQDLLKGESVNKMLYDLRQLVVELRKKNTRITLITLCPSPKIPRFDKRIQTRMDIYNRAILDYATDDIFQCNVIDMYTIFEKEAETFRKDSDRFRKLAKKDPYKVFSDYGRKIFLSALKSCLKQQIEDELSSF